MTNMTMGLMKRLSTWSAVAACCAGCAANAVTEAPGTFGSNPVQVTPASYDAIGGGRLVFERMTDQAVSLNLLDGKARSSRVLLSDETVRGAMLSPDGTRLVYSRLFTEPGFLYWYDLAVRDVASGVETRLTRDAVLQGMPTWSPNGQDVIYPAMASDVPIHDYWQAPASAGGLPARRNLTHFGLGQGGAIACPIGEFAVPAVLSVRDELAFVCQGKVYVRPSNSATIEALTVAGLGGDVKALVWSSDGSQLAFLQFSGDRLLVRSVARNGSSATTITSVPSAASNWGLFNGQSLCWTADGTRLFFNAPKGNESSQIWVVRSDGSGLRQLTNEPGAFDYNVSCT